MIATLRRHAASSLYASAMSPPAAQQTLSALKMIMGECEQSGDRGPRRMAQLRANSNKFREGLIRIGCRVLGDVDSPVIPIMLYHPEKIYHFSQACIRRNLAVVVVGYPATPLLLSRARFCIAATHTEAEMHEALAKIEAAAQEVGVRYDRNSEQSTSADPDAEARARMTALQSASMHGVVETTWVPEPLCKAAAPGSEDPEASYEAAIVTALHGKPVAVDLRTTDFLRMTVDDAPRAAAEAALRKYGCGTCGPRGFYGTLDVHIELEERLARFLGTEGAIIYSYGIATPSSVVPAFVRAGDVLFADDALHFTTAVGVKLARGTTKHFPHNNMEALEGMLRAQAAADKLRPAAKRPRRFLLAEGVYANGQGIANLPELVRLRDEYGCYLIVDETLSIGTLGPTGRGIAEHFGMDPCVIDIIVGSMEHALGSVGGFCAGSAMVVSHQRLSGSGYCFSASLPAYATCAALSALEVLAAEPRRVERLQIAAAALPAALDAHVAKLAHVAVLAHPASPIAHVTLTPAARKALAPRALEKLLRSVAVATAAAPDGGAAVQPIFHSGLAHIQEPAPPSLRLAVHADTDPLSLAPAAKALAAALAAALAEHAHALAHCSEIDEVAQQKAEAKAAAKAAALAEADAPPEAPLSPLDAQNAGHATDAATQAVANAVASAVGDTDAVGPVTVPVLYALEYIRQCSRRYVLRQMEWHAFSLAPQLARLRAARNPTLHALFTVGHYLGSEAFYLTGIPILCWSLGQRAHMNMFVAYFSLNIYVGNWLKNLFALSRPDGGTNTRDTTDYGWPSMYAVNAVGLPFFALRYWFGAFGQGTLYSAENEFLTAASYTVGILWVLVVCGARLYSGASSPADVQGGMLVGGLLVRIWLPVCEDVDAILTNLSADLMGIPTPALLVLLALGAMLVHPFTPGDPRSWTALAFSTKAIAFATSFIIGANTCASQSWCNPDLDGPEIAAAPAQSSWLGWPRAPPPPAAAPSPETLGELASLGSVYAAARLVVRNAVGFALLFSTAHLAAFASRRLEAPLSLAIPSKPCVPRIVRNAIVFTANGLIVSLGVPTVITALGL